MNYLIVGGVAAGTKAAAKIKRCDRSADVRVITRDADISYAGCGLPYYIGGGIATRDELIVNTPAKYEGLTGVHVETGVEATGLDAQAKLVSVRRADGTVGSEPYDKLVIATGAAPFVPPVAGTDLAGVFCVRTPDDAEGIRAYVEANGCRSAVVVGAGFIGLEVAENLAARGLSITVIDAADQIMPNAYDPEMAAWATRQLKASGWRVMTSTPAHRHPRRRGRRRRARRGRRDPERGAARGHRGARHRHPPRHRLARGLRHRDAQGLHPRGRVHADEPPGRLRRGRLRRGEKRHHGRAPVERHGLHGEHLRPRARKDPHRHPHALPRRARHGRGEARGGAQRRPLRPH